MNIQESTLNYFKKQVNVDLNKYRDETTKLFDKRNRICIDWKQVSRRDQQLIQQAALAYGGKYKLELTNWAMYISPVSK